MQLSLNYPSQQAVSLREYLGTKPSDDLIERKYVHQCIESNLILLELRIEELEKMQGTAISSMIQECRTKIHGLTELFGSIREIKTLTIPTVETELSNRIDSKIKERETDLERYNTYLETMFSRILISRAKVEIELLKSLKA